MSLLIKALKQAERSHQNHEADAELEVEDTLGLAPSDPQPAEASKAQDKQLAQEASVQTGSRDLSTQSNDWSMTLEMPAPPRAADELTTQEDRDEQQAMPALDSQEYESVATPDNALADETIRSTLHADPVEDAGIDPTGTESSEQTNASLLEFATESVEDLSAAHDRIDEINESPSFQQEESLALAEPETALPHEDEAPHGFDSGTQAAVESPQMEVAPVVAAKTRRSTAKILFGVVLTAVLAVAGWLGWQQFATPTFDVPAADPMMPDPMLATTQGPDAVGTRNENGLASTTVNIARSDAVVAEGGYVATQATDGKVAVLDVTGSPGLNASTNKTRQNAASASVDNPIAKSQTSKTNAQSVRSVPGSTPSAAISSAPSVSNSAPERSSAATTTSVSTTNRIDAKAGPTQAPRAAATPPTTAPATPIQAPPTPTVRFKRQLSPTERAILLKQSAYRAMRANRTDEAQKLYRDVLARNPLDTDAWIGLATLSAQAGDTQLAQQQYERALAIDPNDRVARAGLLSVTLDDDAVTRESRLRSLIASGLSGAGVSFELGNALAEQSRWVDAQEAYFDAVSRAPDNADYAFNLAIALDRIRQPAAALQYYIQAMNLAERGPSNFDLNAARERVTQLRATQTTR